MLYYFFMATFDQFISTFSTNPNKKGEQFEYFVKEFLKNDLYWKSKVKTIWPFKDAPIKWGTDTGTDLIFKDFEGRYWAVQAKKYAPNYHVKKEDINSFLTDSNRSKIYKRLLIIATDKIGNNAIKTIVGQEKNVVIFRLQDFHDRGNIYPDKLEDIVKFKKPEIPTPKLHQREAIKDVVQKFKKCSKGQLIMACGTGKTYTAFNIIWRLWKSKQVKRVLFLADRNILVDQTMVNDFQPFKDVMTKMGSHSVDDNGNPDTSYEIYLALYPAICMVGIRLPVLSTD